MNHIFVTGAAGFIGARICEMLSEEGIQVTGIDNFSPTYDIALKNYRLNKLRQLPEFSFYPGDITDFDLLTQIFEKNKFDAVINIAGIPGVRLSVENPWLFLEANTKGALNLLEVCRRNDVGKFIQASTSSVYGKDAPFPTPETADSSHPLQPYSSSKKGAETMAYAYHYLYGLDVTVTRFFTVYGPAGRPDMAIFRFIKWISEGTPLKVNGDGTQTRGFTYIDDIAQGTILALKKVGYEIVNLGGHESVSINDLIHRLEDIIGKKAIIDYRPIFKADMLANLADVTKARTLLNWNPRINLDEGLQQTVAWHRQEQSWLQNIKID